MGTGNIRGPLFVLLGALCFSITGFLQAIAPNGATPYTVACARMLVGAVALFLFNQLFRGGVKWEQWAWKEIVISAFCLWCYQILFFNSILKVGVAVGTVVAIGVTPIFSGIVNFFITKKLPQKVWYLATLMAIVGLVSINLNGEANFNYIDLALPVLAGAGYSVYLCVSPKLTVNHTAEESMMMVTGMVALGLIPLALTQNNEWLFSVHGVLIAMGLGIISTAVAFSLTVSGIKTTPTPVAATLALGEPMGAALLGILALGEPCTMNTIFGIGLIFAAVLLLIYVETKKQSNRS